MGVIDCCVQPLDRSHGPLVKAFDAIHREKSSDLGPDSISCQYRKSHFGDKMVAKSSYLHNGISYTGKITSLYWIDPLGLLGGTMQHHRYIEIVWVLLLPWGTPIFGYNFELVQNNVPPKHAKLLLFLNSQMSRWWKSRDESHWVSGKSKSVWVKDMDHSSSKVAELHLSVEQTFLPRWAGEGCRCWCRWWWWGKPRAVCAVLAPRSGHTRCWTDQTFMSTIKHGSVPPS